LFDAYEHYGGSTLLLSLLAGSISALPSLFTTSSLQQHPVMVHEALNCIMTIIIVIIIMSRPGITCLSKCNPESECLLHSAAMPLIGPVPLQEHSFGR